MNRFLSSLAVALLVASAGLHAQQLGVTNTSPSVFSGSGWTLGYEFQVTSPVVVDGLATFDYSNSLASDTTIGLWTDAGSLIASAQLPAVTASSLNGFAVAWVTPFLLTPGNYDVGSYDAGDYYEGFGSATTAPGITFLVDRYNSYGTGFGYPSFSDEPQGVPGWLGGNIVVGGTVSAPDAASSALLMAAGCVALVAARRKLAPSAV